VATLDPESKRKGIETAVKLGLIGVACAVAAPLAWMALEGAIAIAAFAGVALLAWGAAPAVATYVANKRIQALVAVIEANPIETMQNLYVEKSEELEQQASAVRDFDTEVRNVKDMIRQFEQTDPEEAKEYREMADQMEAGLIELKREQTAATGELASFKGQIDKARRIYKMAQAMNKALEKSTSAQAQVFADIKEKVAFDTVRTNLNRAFSNLSSAVDRRRNSAMFAPKQLTEGPLKAEVVDLGKVATKVPLHL
jgi:chromosome segregation ATPase